MVRKPTVRISSDQMEAFFNLVTDCIKVYVDKEGSIQPYRVGGGNQRPLISSGYVEFLMQLYCRSRIKKADFKAETYFRPKMDKEKRDAFVTELMRRLATRKETTAWYYYEDFVEGSTGGWSDLQVCEIVQKVLEDQGFQSISPAHMVTQIHKHVEEPLLRLVELELGILMDASDLKRNLRLFFNQRKKFWGLF